MRNILIEIILLFMLKNSGHEKFRTKNKFFKRIKFILRGVTEVIIYSVAMNKHKDM